MDINRTGTILNTEKYQECVRFYRDLFGLKVLFEKTDGDFQLTCFDLVGSYLMIETGGSASAEGSVPGKSIAENATKLRFNVANIEAALQDVLAYGLDATIEAFAWGSVINIHDPDGNRVGIRDEAGFLRQLDE